MENEWKPSSADRERFLLRRAAGSWWLLDTAQTGSPYRPPVQLNETGARIWSMACQGRTAAEMAAAVSGREPPPEEALADTLAFLSQLREKLHD